MTSNIGGPIITRRITKRTGFKMNKIPDSQHSEIIALYASGKCLREIGQAFGVSITTIRNILLQHDVSRRMRGAGRGGSSSIPDADKKAADKRDRMELWAIQKWGVGQSEYQAFLAEFGSTLVRSSPLSKYREQKAKAKRRGIRWEFTLATWWISWQESGKWNQRGRRSDQYVMARYNDGDTPYSPSTVYFCTNAQNTKDGFVVIPANVRFADTSVGLGCGKGYRQTKSRAKETFSAEFRHKHLGTFDTPELARAAYLAAADEYKRSQA